MSAKVTRLRVLATTAGNVAVVFSGATFGEESAVGADTRAAPGSS